MEVLSPATSLKDKRDKKKLYERFGIKEYIIAYPEDLFIERYILSDGAYRQPDILGPGEILSLAFLEGIQIPLADVFDKEQL